MTQDLWRRRSQAHAPKSSCRLRAFAIVPLLLAFVTLSAASTVRAQNPQFEKIHEGKHWTWFARGDQFQQQRKDIEALYGYADKALETLCEAWGLRPPQDRYTLLVMDRPGGGFAAGDISEARAVTGKHSPGIGCSYDAFSGTANGIKAYWAHILITHEMVNLFTGQIVSGGWPVDWWANHRSPFPLMTAVQIEYALVPEMAVFHERQGRRDPLVVMFLKLKDQYGWALFRKAFHVAKSDGIHWDALGANPSKILTCYVAAYLHIGAPEDIAGILGPQVPGYDVRVVRDIIKARSRWSALPEQSARRRALKESFLRGDYQAALK